jgi:hypothetical protein
MEAVAYQASEEGGSLPRGLKSLRENSALSPEGTSESSPGRSPGLMISKLNSPARDG